MDPESNHFGQRLLMLPKFLKNCIRNPLIDSEKCLLREANTPRYDAKIVAPSSTLKI